MNEQIIQRISQYEKPGDFTHVTPTPEMLAQVKEELGVTLPQQYLDYLATYSHGGIDGIAILGIGLTGSPVFARVTKEYREDGLPANLVVVENCDEWLYCIDCETGEVVSWSPYDTRKPRVDYPDFDSFLLDRLNDAIENMS